MNSNKVTRRVFLNKTVATGWAAAIATSRTRPILGANERVVMGIIGSGGMGRHHMNKFKIIKKCEKIYRKLSMILAKIFLNFHKRSDVLMIQVTHFLKIEKNMRQL